MNIFYLGDPETGYTFRVLREEDNVYSWVCPAGRHTYVKCTEDGTILFIDLFFLNETDESTRRVRPPGSRFRLGQRGMRFVYCLGVHLGTITEVRVRDSWTPRSHHHINSATLRFDYSIDECRKFVPPVRPFSTAATEDDVAKRVHDYGWYGLYNFKHVDPERPTMLSVSIDMLAENTACHL